MVHELMKADLRSTIRNGQLGEEDIVEIMYGLAVSLRQLHTAGIVHRDVKPNNVLLDTTPDDTEFVVKMTDFGLSRGINSVKDAGVSGEPLTDYVITRWYRFVYCMFFLFAFRIFVRVGPCHVGLCFSIV